MSTTLAEDLSTLLHNHNVARTDAQCDNLSLYLIDCLASMHACVERVQNARADALLEESEKSRTCL